MDKVLGKVNQTRLNWYQALKNGMNLKGYGYYKPPAELKYRYPAPGSVPHDEVDHPISTRSTGRHPIESRLTTFRKRIRLFLMMSTLRSQPQASPSSTPPTTMTT